MLSERRPVAGPPRGVTAGGRYVGKKTQRGCGCFCLSPLTTGVMNPSADSSRHTIRVKLHPFGCVTLCCVWLPITHRACVWASVSRCCATQPASSWRPAACLWVSLVEMFGVWCVVSHPRSYFVWVVTLQWYTLLWKLWNSLRSDIRNIDSLPLFKYTLKTHLFRTAYSLWQRCYIWFYLPFYYFIYNLFIYCVVFICCFIAFVLSCKVSSSVQKGAHE